jgi:hypothetical protein
VRKPLPPRILPAGGQTGASPDGTQPCHSQRDFTPTPKAYVKADAGPLAQHLLVLAVGSTPEARPSFPAAGPPRRRPGTGQPAGSGR